MTREEHLVFCKRCTNRKMDFQTGLICGLTNEKAAFEKDCPDFEQDGKVGTHLDQVETVDNDRVLTKLTTNQQEKFISEQNYQLGVIMSLAAGILGAVIWGVISVTTGYQVGLIAVAIGAGVGFAMRHFGNGIENKFGITAGIIGAISCLLGNYFTIIGYVANENDLSYYETMWRLDYAVLPDLMIASFGVMDLVFFGIAAFEAYKFAFRKFTEKDLFSLENEQIKNG